MISLSVPADLMEAIRRHPGRFLDFKSLTALYHFITGARWIYGDGSPGDPAWFTIPSDFADWVECRTRRSDPCRGFIKPILATTPSEEKAFDRFFELLDEYHSRVPTIIAEVTGVPAPEREPWEEEVEVPPPGPILIVKFTDDPGFFTHYQSPLYREGYGFCQQLSFNRCTFEGEWHIRDQAAYEKILSEDQPDWEQYRAVALAKRAHTSPSPSWWTGTSPERHPASAFRPQKQSASSPLPTVTKAIARSSNPSSYLHSIRSAPLHTLDSKSLTALHHHIKGYHHALATRPGLPDQLRFTLPDDFPDWVAHRTRFPDPSIGWCAMIVRTSANEEAAFDRFFELLEDYYSHHS